MTAVEQKHKDIYDYHEKIRLENIKRLAECLFPDRIEDDELTLSEELKVNLLLAFDLIGQQRKSIEYLTKEVKYLKDFFGIGEPVNDA